jgi:hypothetical protein
LPLLRLLACGGGAFPQPAAAKSDMGTLKSILSAKPGGPNLVRKGGKTTLARAAAPKLCVDSLYCS